MPRRRTIPAPPPVERSFMDLAVNYFLDAPVGEINVLMPVIDAIVARRLAMAYQPQAASDPTGPGEDYPPNLTPDPLPAPAVADPAPAAVSGPSFRRRRRRASATVGPVAVPAAEPVAEAEVEPVTPLVDTVGDDPDVVQG